MSSKVRIVVMGVSGVGKTAVGRALAQRMALAFFDADDYHPESNKSKMEAGQPLNDQDRSPWLTALGRMLQEQQNGAVLACSALKEAYRKQIDPDGAYLWVYLKGDYRLIDERLRRRKDHFFPPALLQSQLDTLEPPAYGLHMNASQPIEALVDRIAQGAGEFARSEFGLIGLGAMGKNLALNFLGSGIALSVYNRAVGEEMQVVKHFLDDFEGTNCLGYTQLREFVLSLQRPRKILLMIPAGKATKSVVAQLIPLLTKGDMIIDGGNAHYKDTEQTQAECAKKGISFLGCGISGGWKGALEGPSLMLGGDGEKARQLLPYLKRISASDHTSGNCANWVGPGGAGHFVKMIHNGMEYVEMQLLAELVSVLIQQHVPETISDLFAEWNTTQEASYLLEITTRILKYKEDDELLFPQIRDVASTKGTGGWSVQAATELGVPFGLMAAALNARFNSMQYALRQRIGTSHEDQTKEVPDTARLQRAYRFCRVINHHQGFELIRKASKVFGWEIDLIDLARIWTGGCIIQSKLMENLASMHTWNTPLVEMDAFKTELRPHREAAQELVVYGLHSRIALPCFTAAVSDYDALHTVRSSANIIQAQRDYFGQHGFTRTDRPEDESFSANWN